jgi:hypothetical protein
VKWAQTSEAEDELDDSEEKAWRRTFGRVDTRTNCSRDALGALKIDEDQRRSKRPHDVIDASSASQLADVRETVVCHCQFSLTLSTPT